MRAVIQRVSKASVTTSSGHEASVGKGLLILVGIEEIDSMEDVSWLSGKISRLRIFSDREGNMNLSVKDVEGDCLVVSQFTLHAYTKKGNRPSFVRAARPEQAVPLYEKFLSQLETDTGREVKSGVFGDHMDIALVNDGPVTIVMDTKNKE